MMKSLIVVDDNNVITNIAYGKQALADFMEAPEEIEHLIEIGANINDLFHRKKRADLLAGSDWTQANDSPLSDDEKAAWATYRQALRDITDGEDYPEEVIWPTAP